MRKVNGALSNETLKTILYNVKKALPRVSQYSRINVQQLVFRSEGRTKQCVEVTNLVMDVRRAVVVIRVVVILLWHCWAFCQRGTRGRGSGVFEHVYTNEHEISSEQMSEQRKLTGLLKELVCRKTQRSCSSLKLKYVWQSPCRI